MNFVDLMLIGLVLMGAITGYRQGFVAGLFGFVGFLGGAAVGMVLVPVAVQNWESPIVKVAVTVIAVLTFAGIGQVLFGIAGGRIRDAIDWRPVRIADALGGGLISAVAVVLVAWFLAIAVVAGPSSALTQQVRGSTILAQVDGVMPAQGRDLFSTLRNAFDESFFPQVFAGIVTPALVPVAPPDGDLATSSIASEVRSSVVEVVGDSETCNKGVTGSGFVFADERIMTNAHVVAGTDRLFVRVGGSGAPLRAEVVLFDPQVDIAVLRVPGLRSDALRFATREASRGDGSIVIGFPGGKAYTVGSARVRDVQRARGTDIYDKKAVVREIYSLRATVRPGNSGGPMLDSAGRVLGMVFAASVDDPETGYALTQGEIADDAAAGARATASVSTGSCL